MPDFSRRVSVTSKMSIRPKEITARILFLPLIFVSLFAVGATAMPFAKVTVKTPGELLLGKTQTADVTITVFASTPLLEVSTQSQGAGITLPGQRKWSFKNLKAGSKTRLKVPYQLANGFKKGSVQFEIFTVESKSGPNHIPAQKQTATLTLSR